MPKREEDPSRDADVFRRQFLQKLDGLSDRIDQLLELGQLLLLAVKEAAEVGVPGGVLAGLVGRVLEKFQEAAAEYAAKASGRK
jgi:hypothetical protein